MRADRPRRRGFTLVELMVALVVSAIVVLGARMLLEQLADGATRIVAVAARADAAANGERLLRDLVGQVEIGTDGATRFSGDATAASFGSWCDTPSGWKERCAVSLIARNEAGGSGLVATIAAGDSLVLLRRRAPMELRYLDDPHDGGRWFTSWGAGITAPVAIAVISGSDTMIVRVGARG